MGRVISTAIQFTDAFSNPSKQTLDSMRKLANQAKATGKSIQNAGKVIQGAGKSMTKSVTAPIAGVGVAAVKTAADFESSMSNVKAITGATGKDFKQLEKLGKDLGASTAWTAKEVSQAMQYTGMAGWTAADNVSGLKGILDLASASGTDLARTSDIMTDAISAFGYKASDSTKFADTMTKACTSANVSVETLGESYKYCGAISGTMGYAIDEVTTSLAAMGNMGIKGSQAGTTLKNAISNMSAPTQTMKTAMDKLGISITNQDGSMKSWDNVIKNLQTSFKGLTQDQQAAYAKQIFGKESMAGMLAIINTSTKDYNKLSGAIKNSGGAADQTAKTQLDNLNGQLTLLKSAAEGAAITIGNKLTPYIKTATEWVQKAVDKFNSLSDVQVTSIMKWAGIAAAIAPCLFLFGSMVSGVGKMALIYRNVIATVVKFKGVLGAVTSPAGIVIGVMAALAVAAVLVIKNWDKIKPVVMNVKAWFVDTFGGTIQRAVSGFRKTFTDVMGSVQPTIQTVINTVKTIIPIISVGFAGAWKSIQSILGTAGNIIKDVAGVVGKLLANAFSFAAKTVIKAMPTINRIAKVIGEVLVYAIRNVVPAVTNLVRAISAGFATAYHVVSGALGKMRPVFNVIDTVISTVMNVVQNVVIAKFGTVESKITAVASSIKQVIDGVTKVFNGLTDFISGTFTGNWSLAWNGVKNIFGGVFDGLAGMCKIPINAVIGTINGAIKGINSISVDIPEGVPGVGGKHVGFSIPTIPTLAKGTTDWKGGIVQISEKGGEIVDLPKGSRVYPHDQSVKMARDSSNEKLASVDRRITKLEKAKNGRKGDINISIPKLADQIIIRDETDIDAIAEVMASKLRDTAENMGVA